MLYLTINIISHVKKVNDIDIDIINVELVNEIMRSAERTKSIGIKNVPWWNNSYHRAEKARNKTFKQQNKT